MSTRDCPLAGNKGFWIISPGNHFVFCLWGSQFFFLFFFLFVFLSPTARVIWCSSHLKRKNETFYCNKISDNLIISFSSGNVNACIQAGFLVQNRLLCINSAISLPVTTTGTRVASKIYVKDSLGNCLIHQKWQFTVVVLLFFTGHVNFSCLDVAWTVCKFVCLLLGSGSPVLFWIKTSLPPSSSVFTTVDFETWHFREYWHSWLKTCPACYICYILKTVTG